MDRICYLVFGVKIPLLLQYSLPLIVFYTFISPFINNKYFRFLLILIPPVVIFIRLLRNDPFFLSDDFAHLKLVSENSYFEIAKNAFTGSGIWVGHRIIGAFWLFKLIFQSLGAKAEAFLTANFILHAINVLFFYLIVQKLKKTSFAVLSAFIVGSYYLTWISNIHEIMGATFALLATFFWVKWLKKEGKTYMWTILFYILAILTKEITFVLPISLVFITIFYNYNVSPIEKDKAVKHLIPFAVIFLIYLFTYGVGFLNYRILPSQDSYKIAFNFTPIIQNLQFYGGYTFPIAKSSTASLVLIFSIFVVFDSVKKKPIMIPALASFFIFLGPALLFEGRVSPYYSYIATFFLFIGLTFFLSEIHTSLTNILNKRPKIWLKIFNVYFVLFLLIGVFGMNKLFMDNCFLIQYTWKNELKERVTGVTKKIEEVSQYREIKRGTEIGLEEAEMDEDMKFIYESETLQLFLRSERLKGFKYKFIEDRSLLLVEEAL
ncbi:hypothetical protein A3E15_03190 [Candidatus Woesebacteria bacterium RIFCSPHIGHO2_12_FULL_42_9]|uniref:Glycosyltransferase RgtA/B/C/D-like domain-containing protein n=3 Tax=Candidatus Woeseibacteriota TaxID=1752722 RepID=A0A1F8AUL0_9BACT|nr:MAG: hypothetical protein UT23_C0036G0008 [Candidatus Woesebacteria bacterium GW2011_GWA1_39_12]OGM06230.1 MAG: hypothetical protein A2129_00110 [Candidatus Woesebacteria bacterium GWC1_42_13]OGM55427.1 MAG: hypothetical protein A3E15_03190 [Candidatus Woesebacteria bacterium RIFCSPHIGHO2_12_FULL_42_9]